MACWLKFNSLLFYPFCKWILPPGFQLLLAQTTRFILQNAERKKGKGRKEVKSVCLLI